MSMEEQQASSHRPQRVRQQISVPFLWEEKPGQPKRDWKMPDAAPLISFPSLVSFPSPARLIISVPFQWEEKPGKPILSPQQSLDSLPPIASPGLFSNLPPLLTTTNPFIDFEDSDPFLPNHPWSLTDESIDQQNGYSASETETSSNSSSSATQNANSGPILEFLFPLTSPDAGFLDDTCREARIAPDAAPEKLPNRISGEDKLLVKRTLTLGELILLSRKLSYRRKATQIKKERNSMRLGEFIPKNLLICFRFRTSNLRAFPSKPSKVNIMHISPADTDCTGTLDTRSALLNSEGMMLTFAK